MSKKVEQEAFEYLKKHVKQQFPRAVLIDTRNKGQGKSQGIADAILEIDNGSDKKVFHIEIKACSKELGTNIRFTHQTISKAHAARKDLIVALICNLADAKKTTVTFFSLDAIERVLVEPHFIVQRQDIKNRTSSLSELLNGGETELKNLSSLFGSTIQEHFSKRL